MLLPETLVIIMFQTSINYSFPKLPIIVLLDANHSTLPKRSIIVLDMRPIRIVRDLEMLAVIPSDMLAITVS